MEGLHEQCKLLTSNSEIREGRAKCQEAIEKVTRTVKQVKDRLNALEELNAEIVTQAEVCSPPFSCTFLVTQLQPLKG